MKIGNSFNFAILTAQSIFVILFFNLIFMYCWYTCMWKSVQFYGVNFLLLHVFWGMTSSHQTCMACTLFAGPSFLPYFCYFNYYFLLYKTAWSVFHIFSNCSAFYFICHSEPFSPFRSPFIEGLSSCYMLTSFIVCLFSFYFYHSMLGTYISSVYT